MAEAEGQEGDRGLMSFAANLMNKPKVAPPSTPLLDSDLKAVTLAFKGVGTKEKELMGVLCNRSKEHLLQLKALYNYNNKLDLLSRIQLETSGRFQRLFEGMISSDAEMRACYVKHAVDGIGTNEMMLIDTLLTCTNKQMKEVQAAYKASFLIPMGLRVDWDTSGKLQEILDAAMRCSRPETGVQKDMLNQDVDVLLKATEQKLGTDEKALIHILASRSRDHVAELNALYATKSKTKKPFIETIKAETSGVVERAFLASFLTPPQWHAFRIYAAMKGLGTDEESLMRCILLPSQTELKVAIRIIKTQYKQDLVKELKGELWGNVRDALVTYVDFVNANVPDVGDAPSAQAAAAAVVAAPAGAAAAAAASLTTNPYANRVWKSLEEEVGVLRADNIALRTELNKLKGATVATAAASGSRELPTEAAFGGERSFKF